MSFPLNLWDVVFWFAITAVILVITSELISPRYGHRNLLINKKKLRKTALAVSVLFVIALSIRIVATII